MASPISLFSGYTQKENRTTNYCLLVLKMLYEENPKYLAETLGHLIDPDVASAVGVRFGQQRRTMDLVPDGIIEQSGFAIAIETKLGDNFVGKPLGRYADGLVARHPHDRKVLLALGNFEVESDAQFAEVREYCKTCGVTFATVTFEKLIEAIPRDRLPRNLSDTIDDFETYLDEEGLLPTWKCRLDVVNCAREINSVLASRVFACPSSGGAYTHRRSRFFGTYKNKRVEHVAEIEAVVEFSDGEPMKTLWKNVDGTDAGFMQTAKQRYQAYEPKLTNALVFVLGEIHKTDFRKQSPGGLFGSKRYFEVDAADAAELARKLKGQTWESHQSNL